MRNVIFSRHFNHSRLRGGGDGDGQRNWARGERIDGDGLCHTVVRYSDRRRRRVDDSRRVPRRERGRRRGSRVNRNGQRNRVRGEGINGDGLRDTVVRLSYRGRSWIDDGGRVARRQRLRWQGLRRQGACARPSERGSLRLWRRRIHHRKALRVVWI